MLATQHLEDSVDAFAAGEILHDLFIFMPLVVDAVLQAELFHSRQLFVGGRSAIHFYAEQAADLHGGSTNASSYGVDEDAGVRGGAALRSTAPSVPLRAGESGCPTRLLASCQPASTRDRR